MIIRHEINILNGSLVSGAAVVSSSELIGTYITNFSGSLTYILEIVAINTAVTDNTANLWISGTNINMFGSITIPANTTNYAVFRTTGLATGKSFTAADAYKLVVGSPAGATVKSARLIILQDTSTSDLIGSESQFEIGTKETGLISTTAGTALTRKAYWKYDAASWDGTKTFYAEAVYNTVTTNTITVVLQESSVDLANPTWTTKITIVNAATNVNATKSARVPFTPVDGRMYRIAYSNSTTMSGCAVYNAKVIVQQSAYSGADYYNGSQDIGQNIGVNTQGIGQSFNGNGSTFTSATFFIQNLNSANTGTLTAVLYAHTGTFGTSSLPTGAALDTSAAYSLGSLSTTSFGMATFTFSGGVTLVNGTKYFIAVQFANATEVYVSVSSTSPTHGGNMAIMNSSNVWSVSAANDLNFYINQTTSYPTKLEEQYLLANTTIAAGTALQTFLTKWDTTEWSDVDNVYVHQVEATDANTSVVEIDTAAGVQVANSVVNSPDNIGQSYTDFNNTTNSNASLPDTTQMLGQSFTPNNTGVLSSVYFKLSKSGNPGNLTASIYAHTGTYGTSSKGTGSPLAVSDAMSSSGLSATLTNIQFTFSGANKITLTSGTNYVVVVQCSSLDVSNTINVALNTTSVHSGNRTDYNGTSWVSFSTADLVFGVQLNMTMPTTGNLDVKATTNVASVYASRILVRSVKTAPPATTTTTTLPPTFVYSAFLLLGVG